MCGIVGFISPNRIKENLIHSIMHRGPDGNGTFEWGNVTLGHVRLSIQDLSENGAQPMHTGDDNYILIFNGEIYNHWEIRKEIEDKYDFKSNSDTETLLHGFAEYGIDIVNKLNGIFAFAILDKKSNELYLARDHYGVKPLYFYKNDSIIAFSSELKTISKVNNVNKEIDYSALVNYINYLWSPGEKTPFKHIKKILPGHYLKIDLDSYEVESKKYYQIPFDGNYKFNNEKETIDLLDKKLNEAVERQLLADVEIGFFLSGGLDSSLLVAIASKKLDYKLKCFTVKTESGTDGFTSDLDYARMVAKQYDLPLIEVPIEVDIVDEFDKMIYHLDEPQADPAPLNVLKICEKAKEMGVKVMIGGTAGDDLFSGYRRHQALQFEKYFKKTPKIVRVISKQIVNSFSSKNVTVRRIKKLLNGIELSSLDRRVNYFSWLDLEKNKSLFNENIQSRIVDYKPHDYLLNSLKDIPLEKNHLNQMLYWEMISFLADHNLNYTDKMSMATGVEVRVPFLDRELVDFSTKIHPDLKLKGKETKYILKKVAERYLPKEVIYRPKTGFGAPIREWIINDLNELIENRLSKENIIKRGIFDFESVNKLINDNKKGKIDASYTIWSLLATESWMRQFVD